MVHPLDNHFHTQLVQRIVQSEILDLSVHEFNALQVPFGHAVLVGVEEFHLSGAEYVLLRDRLVLPVESDVEEWRVL